MTSRMNSHGRSVHVLAARIKRTLNRIDAWNERVAAAAVALGWRRARFLHPTKGYRYVNLAKPTPFAGLFDWLSRSFGRAKAIQLYGTLFLPTLARRLRSG